MWESNIIWLCVAARKHTQLLVPCPGWYGSASLLGGYSALATGGKARPAAMVALKTWALALPVCAQLASWPAVWEFCFNVTR